MASISSCTEATRAQCATQSMSGCRSKKLMLSEIEPENSGSSCITTPTMSRQARRPSCDSGTPPISISPDCGAWMPRISFSSVVLPQPEGPTMATDSPGSMRRFTPHSTSGSASE